MRGGVGLVGGSGGRRNMSSPDCYNNYDDLFLLLWLL